MNEIILEDVCLPAKPHYEVGGARFHIKHKLLLSLIRKYNCHKIPLSKMCYF